MDLDVVHARVAAHEADTLLEVSLVAIDPLGVIAPLGDGIEMSGPVIARLSHGGSKAGKGPMLGINDLRRILFQFGMGPVSE
jgi:hypothetical protein